MNHKNRGIYRYQEPSHAFRRLKYSTKIRKARKKWERKREQMWGR